jgi:hypothetical protein
MIIENLKDLRDYLNTKPDDYLESKSAEIFLAGVSRDPLFRDELTGGKKYTWDTLKEFSNTLTKEQLTQEVIFQETDSATAVLSAYELGDDHYIFIDQEYMTTEKDFDKDILEEEGCDTFEGAIEKLDYVLIPANRVYLYGE